MSHKQQEMAFNSVLEGHGEVRAHGLCGRGRTLVKAVSYRRLLGTSAGPRQEGVSDRASFSRGLYTQQLVKSMLPAHQALRVPHPRFLSAAV